MIYLLDTNILVDHLRGTKSIDFELIQAGSTISIITLGELFYGAHKSNNQRESLIMINYLIKSADIEVSGLTEEMVLKFGEIKTSLERSGQRLEDFDLLFQNINRGFGRALLFN